MTVTTNAVLAALAATIVGEPARLDVLKDKPGRRRTVRASGPRGAAIVKAYASDRATTVADRIRSLGDGPPVPELPHVLTVDVDARAVVLSEVPGAPLGEHLDAGRYTHCADAGAAVGTWHHSWLGNPPSALRMHTVEHELELLERRAAGAGGKIGAVVARSLPFLARPWRCDTVVHRDLYETQIVVGDHVGLIDLDDAATGPPELDIGNLLAHLELRAMRTGGAASRTTGTILDGYRRTGPELEPARLQQCRNLSLLRLALVHDEPRLLHLLTPCPATEHPAASRRIQVNMLWT